MPVVPVLAAIGGGSALAGGLTVASAGLGAYQAISGADAARRAANAQQDYAKAAAGGANTAAPVAPDSTSPVSYNTATDYFKNNVYSGDAAPYSNEWNDAFNQWASGLEAKYGVDSYKNLKYGQLTEQVAPGETPGTGSSAVIPSSVAGPGGTVNLNLAQQAAQAVAQQNAANSAELEQQYNPGAQELRSGSLQSLLANLNAPQQGVEGTLPTVPTPGTAPVSAQNQALLAQVAAQAGQPLTGVGYDSPLTRAAIAKAQQDLALGGALPQDVAQLVARKAFAQAGAMTGGRSLGAGRDITARDLGLTSLDLERQRMQQALQAGGAEAGLEGANAAMRLAAQQYARQNLLQSQGATAADQQAQLQAYVQQQQLAQQAAQQEASNYFNQNSLLQSIQSGGFGRNLAAAQFGQNITPPASGLDPGAVVNLAVGNSNVAANAAQNANAVAAQAANNKTAAGSQLLGTALGFAQNFFKPTAAPTYSWSSPTTFGTTGYTPPVTNYSASVPAVFCWVARSVFGADNPEWTQFRDWMLTQGSPELVDFYGQNGEAIAESIKDMPAVKTLIKHLMIAAKGGA